MIPVWLFDLVLATGLVLLAWQSLNAATLFKSVVLFIAFGLFMALAWVRLDAVDVALAEAAIGAGLTGALLLDALGHVAGEPRRPVPDEPDLAADDSFSAGPWARALVIALAAATGVALAAAVWLLPQGAPEIRDRIQAAIAEHPVANPATAVLLDLRAWDTFLEMGVLALAGFGAFLLKTRALRVPRAEPPARGSIMLGVLARWLAPLLVLVALYLFWAGTARSGGAFPAGAMLAGAGVLLFLAGIGREAVVDSALTRFLMGLGLLAFLAAGLATLLMGRLLLDWGEGWTYGAIFALEALLTIAIGATLALLYTASAKEPPEAEATPEPEAEQGAT